MADESQIRTDLIELKNWIISRQVSYVFFEIKTGIDSIDRQVAFLIIQRNAYIRNFINTRSGSDEERFILESVSGIHDSIKKLIGF